MNLFKAHTMDVSEREKKSEMIKKYNKEKKNIIVDQWGVVPGKKTYLSDKNLLST